MNTLEEKRFQKFIKMKRGENLPAFVLQISTN